MIKGITEDFLWEYPSYSKANEITKAVKLKFDTLGYRSILNVSEFAYAMDLRMLTNDDHIALLPPFLTALDYEKSGKKKVKEIHTVIFAGENPRNYLNPKFVVIKKTSCSKKT